MRVAELKEVGKIEIIEKVLIPAEYDENGDLIAEEHEEEVVKIKPKMGVVYRDMTPEEIAALPKEEDIPYEPTDKERLEALEAALLDVILMTGGQ